MCLILETISLIVTGTCCCSPSKTYGRRIVGTLNCCAFSLYNSGILSTMILDLKGVMLFLQGIIFYVYISNFASILCMYVMYVTSLTDSFDDRRSQCHLI